MSIKVYSQFTDKLSIGFQFGVGYDIQQQAKSYTTFNTEFIIPSNIRPSVMRIGNPKLYNVDVNLDLNKNIKLHLSYGKNNRKLMYESFDSVGSQDNCLECKLKLGISQNNIFFGFKFQSDFDSRLNYYFCPSVGFIWIKPSSFYDISIHDPQTELFSINDEKNWYLLHVYQGNDFSEYGTLSLSYKFGISYRLYEKLFLEFELNYNNELINGSRLIIWGYDKINDTKAFGYAPYDIEFKSLFTNIGLNYKF